MHGRDEIIIYFQQNLTDPHFQGTCLIDTLFGTHFERHHMSAGNQQHRSSLKLKSKPLVQAVSLAVCSLALYAGAPADAYAQAQPASNQQGARLAYSIPAGPLAPALRSLASAANVLLSYTPDQASSKTTAGLQGQYTPQAALAALLAGTGLQAVELAPGSYVLRAAAAVAAKAPDAVMPLISVTAVQDGEAATVARGYAPVSVAATKIGTPLIETPRAVSVVTHEQLKAQAPKNIEQSLAYTAGVMTDVAGTDVRMSGATIRGFSDGSSYYQDGLKLLSAGSYGSWNAEMEEVESVEVVKGPASVFYGQGRPGGMINVTSKLPGRDHVNTVGVSAGRYSNYQANADLGGALGANDDLLYRVIVSGRNADDRLVGSQNDRLSLSPSLRWAMSGRSSLTLLGTWSQERGTPKSWWPSLFVYPQIKDLPVSRTAGDPSFDYFNRDTRALGYMFEHAMDSGWRLTQNLRYSTIKVDYQHIYAMDLLADGRTATRANLAEKVDGKTFTVDSRAQQDFRWGAVEHRVVLGVDYLKYKENDGLGFGWDVPNLDIYAPVYGQAIAAPELEYNHKQLRQTGIYTLNQFKLQQWVANLSLRHDRASSSQAATTTTRIRDSATTGSAGLLYLFDNGVAPYASYATSFDPATGSDFYGKAFQPRKGKQVELGVKYQPPGSSTLLTASLFDLTQTNVTTQDPEHPRASIQTGEVRSTGVELEATFKPVNELNVLAGYTYLDPRTTKSNRAWELGRQTIQTTRHAASLWLDYRPNVVPGLMLAAGLRYRGSAPYNGAANALYMNDPYTLADLAVAYETARYRLALNVGNVFDKKYFGGIFRGAEREAQLSLKVNF